MRNRRTAPALAHASPARPHTGLTALLTLALAVASTALTSIALRAQGLTARIDDPRSHGIVGDTKLSLDEAIQLVNDTLKLNQLSAAERARISGAGSLVDLVIVDATLTPVITFERELTPTISVFHGHIDHDIVGVPGPGGAPVLDGTGFTAVLTVRTNHSHVRGLVLRGAKVAVDADASGHFHAGALMRLEDLVLEGQTEAGLRLRVPGIPAVQQTPCRVANVRARSLPIGLDVIDLGRFGTMDLRIEDLHLENVTTGVQVTLSGTGGTSSVKLHRSSIVGSVDCVQVRRTSGSDLAWTLDVLYANLVATRSALDVEGVAGGSGSAGSTTVLVHHSELRGGPLPTDHALRTWPRTARFAVRATENALDGNVALAMGPGSPAPWLGSSRLRNGELRLDLDGAAADLEALHLDAVPVVHEAASSASAVLRQCELVRSPLRGLSTSAPLVVQQSFLGASPASGNVMLSGSVAAPWLGRAAVLPADPRIGTFTDLQLDLEPGTTAAWLVGLSAVAPNTSNRPFRFYVRLDAFVTLPGLWVLQQRVRLPIPADLSLVGVELYAQPVAVPAQPQAGWPSLWLPRGGRFVVQP